MLEDSSRKYAFVLRFWVRPIRDAGSYISPETASCLEGSLHSSGSSGYTSGRTWGRTCIHRERQWKCKCSASYFNKTPNTNKTAMADKAYTLSHPHPSVVYDKGSFLCKNSLGVLSKMLPCISISELLSQLAINSLGQTQPPPPSCRGVWRRLCCSYYAAQCFHSCLSQSQCERPHQQHLPCIINRLRWQVWLPTSILNEGGRREGLRSKRGGVCVCLWWGGGTPEAWKAERGWLTIYSLAPPQGLKHDNFFFNWNYRTVHFSTLPTALSVSLKKTQKTILNELWK